MRKYLLLTVLALALGASAKTVTFTIDANHNLGGTHTNSAGNSTNGSNWFTHWTSPADANGISFKLDRVSGDAASPLREIHDQGKQGVGLHVVDGTLVNQLTLGSGGEEYYVYAYTYKATPTLAGIAFNGQALPAGGITVSESDLSPDDSFALTFSTAKGTAIGTTYRVDLTDFVITLKSRTTQSLTSFSFEEKEMPDQWTVTGAAVDFNNDHATRGSNSMMLTVDAGKQAVATVDLATFTPTSAQALAFDIYAVKSTSTPVAVDFVNASGAVALHGTATLNLKGWQTYHRAYTADYAGAPSYNLKQLRLTIDNTSSSEPLKIYLDNVDFLAKVGTVPTNTNSDATYNAMPLMVADVDQIATLGSTLLKLHSFENDIDLAAPDADALAGLAKIKNAVKFTLDAAPSDADLQTARTFASNLGVTRHPDGTLKCRAIVTSADGYTAAKATELINYLSWLAASDADAALFNDLLAAMMDQNVVYRFPRMRSNTYAPIRLIPRILLACAQKCSDPEVAQRTVEAARWVSESGWAFAPQEYVSKEFSSDILYLFPTFWVGTAANDADSAEAVRQLKGVGNLLAKIVTPNDGGYDMVKPDGCGYHHGYHYNNYMYAYTTWISTAAQLMGTPFRISPQAYADMKRAVLAMYTMSNRSATGTNYFANSLCGRHPFTGGNVNQVKPAHLAKLIEVSADLNGGTPDPELAAAYNHFTMTDKYAVPKVDYSGFYQFNYSPIGVYRSSDWTVTMRCPTEYCIGAEIYSASNRFGRYQSSGSMEVVYNGDPAASGLPSEAKGYDWRIVPGATTVHHSKWSDLTPKGNTSQRFDQLSGGNNYAGALSMGSCGIFSCDYNQTDSYYNTQCFTPTGLHFRKSVLAVDGMLVCLGSSIYATQSTDPVASNLFQELGDYPGATIVNGSPLTDEANISCAESDAWVLSPCGTGYYIPAGNAATLTVKYGTQQGPNENGSDINSPATATAARAYLDHGTAPSNKAYAYVAVPGATPEKMAAMAATFADDFELLSTSGTAHAFRYKPMNLTAISYFKKSSANPQGIVESVGSGMLIMYQTKEDGTIDMHVCVPDLNPVKEGSYVEQWAARPTETHLTLAGDWQVDDNSDVRAVSAKSRAAETTTMLNLNMAQGETKSFTLSPQQSVSISPVASANGEREIYTLQGIRVPAGTNLAPGIYIVKQGARTEKVKIN